MKQYRLYRCRWKGDKIIKTKIVVNEVVYNTSIKHKLKPVDKNLGNTWFEELPYKWYEFNGVKNILNQITKKILNRYSKSIWSVIRDIIVFVFVYIIGAYIYDNFIK